jgi:hypothetical protein
MLPPEDRIWNAYGNGEGQLTFLLPVSSRLPLPEAPPHPMLNGYVIPYGKDGQPLTDLRIRDRAGKCEAATGMPGYPLGYPDRYPVRCYWPGSDEESEDCFSPQRTVEAGDTVFCPGSIWEPHYDPMSFVAVEVTETY